MKPSVALLPALLLAGASGAARAPGVKSLSQPEAARLLAQPVVVDAKSAQVLQRSAAAYGHLQTLVSVSRDGYLVGTARLQRPRRYSFSQNSPDGKLVALALSDGTRYYEYTAKTGRYLERDTAIVDRLALPANVRPFFGTQKPGTSMVGLDDRPAVREYAYRYSGQQKVDGTNADVIRVSTMTHSNQGAWFSFDSIRCYNSGTGLLARVVNGDRTVTITNRANAKLPADAFQWRPPKGAVKGFG